MCLPLGEVVLPCLLERRQSLERVFASPLGEERPSRHSLWNVFLFCLLERRPCLASWRGGTVFGAFLFACWRGVLVPLGEETQSLERVVCLLERRPCLALGRGGAVFGTWFSPLGEEAMSCLLERRPSLWSVFLPLGQEVCLQKPLGEEARAVGAAPRAPGSRSTRPPRISKPSPS